MKNLLLAFALLSLLSCTNSEQKANFEDSRTKDIHEIVQAVIDGDSLNVLKSVKGSACFCEDLVKLAVSLPEKSGDFPFLPPPPPSSGVTIEDLLDNNAKVFFEKKDSLTLLKQISNAKKMKLDTAVFRNIKFTDIQEVIRKRKASESYDYYEMTIPIFSADNLKAYVELNHSCGGLCGSGEGIFLEKIKGKWTIFDNIETWIE